MKLCSRGILLVTSSKNHIFLVGFFLMYELHYVKFTVTAS